jgi:hypothetical protein
VNCWVGTRLSLSRHERGARRDGGGNFAAGALWDVPFRPSGFRGSCGERERRARRREGSEDAPGKTHRAGSEDASGVGGRVRSRDSSHTPNRQTDRKTDHKERPPPSSSMAQGSLPIKRSPDLHPPLLEGPNTFSFQQRTGVSAYFSGRLRFEGGIT